MVGSLLPYLSFPVFTLAPTISNYLQPFSELLFSLPLSHYLSYLPSPELGFTPSLVLNTLYCNNDYLFTLVDYKLQEGRLLMTGFTFVFFNA